MEALKEKEGLDSWTDSQFGTLRPTETKSSLNMSPEENKEDSKIFSASKNQKWGVKPFIPGENSDRPDVVRKSIIRGIKRYYCNLMCKGDPLISNLNSKQALEVLKNIDEVRATFNSLNIFVKFS